MASSAAGKKPDIPLLERAYGLSGKDDAEDLYNEWADTYDKDLNPEEYISPQAAVDAVARQGWPDGTTNITILDAGCGTGLVAECFQNTELAGHCVIDGLDLTKAMLEVARRKGVYRELEEADLTKPIARPDGSYDVITCVGTLTKGHVGPEVLHEFVRVAVKGGYVVATVHIDVWEKLNFKGTVEHLGNSKVVEVVSTDEFDIFRNNPEERGRLVILRKK